MADIDLNTCTMRNVVQRSCEMHPTLFAEACDAAARVHVDYANLGTTRSDTARIASIMAGELRTIARAAEVGSLQVHLLTVSQVVQAFHLACRLQCIPRHIAQAIAAREPAPAEG